MIGQYEGFYKYDNERIQQSLSRDKTIFYLDISEFDGNEFYGMVRDEPRGQPGKGTIYGELKGDKISFIKQMQIAASILPDGKNKVYNTRHPKIYYEGILSEGKYIGTWRINLDLSLSVSCRYRYHRQAENGK